MNKDLVLADWFEEIALYGTPRRVQDAETAHHLSQAIRHCYIVRLALNQNLYPHAVADCVGTGALVGVVTKGQRTKVITGCTNIEVRPAPIGLRALIEI